MVGRITADLGAELIREVEEVDRIASTSRNLKGTYVRRLRQSRKVRAVGAELQQHTGAAFGAPASSQEIEREGEREREREKEERERKNARLRKRVGYLENEVSRLQKTV